MIILMTIYSKTEQEDITARDIHHIILDYDTQAQTPDEGSEKVSTLESAAADDVTTTADGDRQNS